ncbi:hypothetical protein GW17_00025218 [Ensete ventricosum]|nr:hypothetical protein GW17_00025218 [Ensete ventricosum]
MADNKERTSMNADAIGLQKQWDEVLCPICMDHPHNAVVLICTSYEKGCRSYICDTSYRHSNCLDYFRNLRISSSDNPSTSQVEANVSFDESGGGNAPEDNCFKCPLCQGVVLGWMIVKEARQYLDQKLRSCSRESCSYSGNYPGGL